MSSFKRFFCGGLALAAWGAASSGWAALDVKTGLWEITTEGMDGVQRACITRELLEADLSQMPMPPGVKCKMDITASDPRFTTSHTVCTGTFAIEGDTRVDVLSREAMTMKSTSVMNVAGNKQELAVSARYRWLGSDCGDVRPMNLSQPAE